MFRDQANVVGQFKPNNNAPYGNTYNSSRATQDKQPDPPSQQSSSLEQAMANLSKVVGDFVRNQEATNAQINQRIDEWRAYKFEYTARKGRFPSQPHQNPKGVHEVESQEGESSQMKDVKALITLRSGKKIEKPTPKPHVEKEEEIKKGKEMEDKEIQRPGKSYHFSHDWRKGSGESFVRLGSKCESASIFVYKQLGLGELKPTTITLSLADRSVKIPRGVIEDVLVQVDNFYYPVDFIVLDTDPTVKEANLVPIILGRPFLATSNAIINCRNGLMQLTFGNMTLDLNIFYMSKRQTTRKKKREGLSESSVLATLQSWRKIEEILPLFNEEEEAAEKKLQNSI
ncbi:hypothetical protein AAG906_027990 [Vitis piasezkii]